MRDLLAAIRTAFEANATLTAAFPGGIHLREVPAGEAGSPVLVMNVVAGAPTQRYGGLGFEEHALQFTARAADSLAALEAAEAFAAAFDDLALTLAAGRNFFTRRTGVPMPEPADPIPDEAGRPSFGWILTYDFFIHP